MQDYLNISLHKFKNDLIKKEPSYDINVNVNVDISRKRVRCINNSMPMKIACLCVYMMMNHCLPNSFSLSYNV